MVKDFLKNLYYQYYEHKIPFLGASISFYAMLSFLPIALFGFSLLGYILQAEQIRSNILTIIQDQIPILYNFAKANIRTVIAGRQSRGIIGLIFLLWVSTRIFDSMEFALNNIYHIKQPKHFVIHKLTAVFSIVLFGILFLISFSLSSYITNLLNLPTSLFSINPSVFSATSKLLTFILALGFTVTIFLLIYFLIPNRKMKLREVFIGAISAGAIWEFTKYLLIWYLDTFAVYERLYGSLGILIAALIWIHISSQILLIGALINKILWNSDILNEKT